MDRLAGRYAAIVSTLALFVALGGAAWAALERNSVGARQIKSGAVRAAEVKRDAIGPAELELPAPQETGEGGELSATSTTAYTKLAGVGAYEKAEDSTVLRVSWAGAVKPGIYACVFQLRVDGKPADGGAAEAFVPAATALTVSVEGLWSGLGAGPHEIEVFARNLNDESACTLNPAEAGIKPTLVVEEVAV